jgi:hypothetical protein
MSSLDMSNAAAPAERVTRIVAACAARRARGRAGGGEAPAQEDGAALLGRCPQRAQARLTVGMAAPLASIDAGRSAQNGRGACGVLPPARPGHVFGRA